MPRLSKIGAACLAAFGFGTGGAAVSASYLAVAGGGGGGSNAAGGGGAGGMLTGSISLDLATSYVITIGAGGNAGTFLGDNAANGSNTTIGSLVTAIGGGRSRDGGGGFTGVSGGSGSGASTSGSSLLAGGSGTTSQGNAGGSNSGGSNNVSGGGGGAGAVGGNGSGTQAGNGGNGSSSSISGSSVTYAGGGGGGVYTGVYANNYGSGGTGGGGQGGTGSGSSSTNGFNGTANTGGGAGGAGYPGIGGSGGSGIVIISYAGAQKFGGGIVTSVGGNTIHTFTTSGTLSPLNSLTASYLIVAGGGAGLGGGGGAGGMLTGSGLTIDTNSTYLVTVGAGGVAPANGSLPPVNGNNSTFSLVSTIAYGGGGGNTNAGTGNGGSGGGGIDNISYITGGTGVAGQGNNGGNSNYPISSSNGGGGGAGAAGGNGTSSNVGGAGGIGLASSISGTSTYYAGGGGGAGPSGGSAGGLGGGGAGALNSPGIAGQANTGGGGGMGFASAGGNGGSGIVIISYAGSTQQMAGGTVTIVGGNVIHTFTSSGYLTPLTFVGNSLRFRSSASAYLNRTPTVAGNQKTATFSWWMKRGSVASDQCVFSLGTFPTNLFEIIFGADNTFGVQNTPNSSTRDLFLATTQVFRDPAAWYHIVISIDTTQATASNRAKMYVNGVQVTAFGTATYPSQNTNLNMNTAVATQIGRRADGNYYQDAYLSEFRFIDGQALAPTAFGSFNAYGVWQPINYGGSYGTNGFYLPFSNTTSTTTLGYDFSPMGNNWTPNNFSLTAGSTYDSMTDVPTLTSATAANYCTWNAIWSGGTLSAGNLNSANTDTTTNGTMGISSGKFYWEVTVSAVGSQTSIGVIKDTSRYTNGGWGGSDVFLYFNNGNKYGASTNVAYGATYTTGDVIGIALDMTGNTLTFYKNGTSQGTAFSSTQISGLTLIPMYYANGSGSCSANFGQQPFAYTPPTGYVGLNTYNL